MSPTCSVAPQQHWMQTGSHSAKYYTEPERYLKVVSIAGRWVANGNDATSSLKVTKNHLHEGIKTPIPARPLSTVKY